MSNFSGLHTEFGDQLSEDEEGFINSSEDFRQCGL